MLKKIILISMLLLSSQVYAENIDKIFDIELGSKVDVTKHNLISNDKSENFAIYKIDFKGFKKVKAYYTPTTHKIYTILAIKDADSNCEAEAELISVILCKSYGEFTKHERIAETAYLLESENKGLIVGCNGVINKKISIYLADSDLAGLKKKEELEIESLKELNNF
jgi:hypothetical protein